MTKFLSTIIFIGLFYAACSSGRKNSDHAKLNKLEWLAGKWERTNDQGDKKTYEYWKRSSDALYIGLGFTLLKQDTVFKEEIAILALDDILTYKVTGVNLSTTYFMFTDQTDSSFACENRTNEYPQKIEYRIRGNMLTATISGGGPTTSFIFRKK